MADLLAAGVDGREMADRPAPTDVASDGITTRSPVLYEEMWNALQPEPIYSPGRVEQTDKSIDFVDLHSPVLLIRTFFCLSTPRYDENQAKNYSETSKVFQDWGWRFVSCIRRQAAGVDRIPAETKGNYPKLPRSRYCGTPWAGQNQKENCWEVWWLFLFHETELFCSTYLRCGSSTYMKFWSERNSANTGHFERHQGELPYYFSLLFQKSKEVRILLHNLAICFCLK